MNRESDIFWGIPRPRPSPLDRPEDSPLTRFISVSLALTLVADRLGRRRTLLLGALLMVFSGTVFATISNYWILLLAAILGVISPSGNEIGPFRAVEESTLAHLSEAKTRSDIFALYVVAGTLGTAGGSLAAGWSTQAVQTSGWSEVASYRLVFWVYAAIGVVKAGMTTLLSAKCEMQPEPIQQPVQLHSNTRAQSEERQPFLEDAGDHGEESPQPQPQPKKPEKKTSWIQLSPKSRYTLLRLCGLFFFDSLARYVSNVHETRRLLTELVEWYRPRLWYTSYRANLACLKGLSDRSWPRRSSFPV